MRQFETLEHTADLALRVWGRDLRELIENAAAGLISLLYNETPPAAADERPLRVVAEAPELVLHHALRELLYLLEDEGLAVVEVRVTSADEEGAELLAGVVPRDQVAQLLGGPIKAVTHHGLEIRREGGQLLVDLVFDV